MKIQLNRCSERNVGAARANTSVPSSGQMAIEPSKIKLAKVCAAQRVKNRFGHWMGLRENLQESPIFHGKISGFPVKIVPKKTNPLRTGSVNWAFNTHRIRMYAILYNCNIYHQYTPVMLASIYHTYGSVMGYERNCLWFYAVILPWCAEWSGIFAFLQAQSRLLHGGSNVFEVYFLWTQRPEKNDLSSNPTQSQIH